VSTVRIEEVGGAGLERARKLLGAFPGGAEKAISGALQRSASHIRANAAKAIRARYDISAANIRAEERIKVTRQNRAGGMSVSVEFKGNRIPLHKYGGSHPKEPTPDVGRRVAAVVEGGWRKVYPGVPARGHQLKGTAPSQFVRAFVARMKSGHIGIFERTGGRAASGGDAIRELMGSSVPQMLGSPEVEQSLAEGALAKFDERIEHEIRRIINGW
jgi:hypothetical protein